MSEANESVTLTEAAGGTVRVGYRCRCLQGTQWVEVPARIDAALQYWVNDVLSPRVAADHARRSPGCRQTRVDLLVRPGADGRVGSPGDPSAEVMSEWERQMKRSPPMNTEPRA